VGIFVEKKPGMRVAEGEPLARLRVRDRNGSAIVAERVLSAFVIADTPPPKRALVLDRIEAKSTPAYVAD
jgi:thymidine phosphorylase